MILSWFRAGDSRRVAVKLEQRAAEKKSELIQVARAAFGPSVPHADQLSSEVISAFCHITPPEADVSIDMVTIARASQGGRGRSVKPGNILLNWKKVIEFVPEGILTITGATANPWMYALAALVVWNRVWSLLQIEITEAHAVVIWSMWTNRDKDNRIEEEKLLRVVNMSLASTQREPMHHSELHNILMELEKLQCIKPLEGKWWLREWVRKPYK